MPSGAGVPVSKELEGRNAEEWFCIFDNPQS